uniref:Uncharacterized protein LOC111136165 n=1 Tax=Crassostrea virginica TaxID=6565 RepID=A0A8B8ERE6_CRAVI|nr:uncharacterized protein LOC111136165 [Crassostrea virginica]
MSECLEMQISSQHYMVCGAENCTQNGLFYCNACHQTLCQQCKDEHLKSSKTQTHEIVLYRHRKPQIPVEKCDLHPTRNVDIFCRECKVRLCSKCSTMKEHKGHEFDDLEEIFTEKYFLCQDKLLRIKTYFLPSSHGLKLDIKKDAMQIKKIMENIRTSMKAEAESLKILVDEVTSENIEHTYSMEKSLLKMLKSQVTTYDDYIAYLENMTDIFQNYLSKTNQKQLFSETLKIKTFPESFKPSLPVFITGQFNRYDIIKLLGRVNFPNIEPKKRKIQLMGGVSTHLKFTEKQLEQSKENSDMKISLPLSTYVTKVREYSVPGVDSIYHVLVDKKCRLWVSDDEGNIVQTDEQGNLLQRIQTRSAFEGYHTTTQDGDLIYADRDKRVIYRIRRIIPGKTITDFTKTGGWTPISVHSSRNNRDILVGLKKDEEGKVTKYNMATMQKIQNIQIDKRGQELYSDPHYITENINGDICTSDYEKQAVVVVNKSGEHRFSYTGQGRMLRPWGICTDVLGHILVCDVTSSGVHLLNKDGKFISFILSSLQGIHGPRCVCADDKNNIYLGQHHTRTVTVYNYS